MFQLHICIRGLLILYCIGAIWAHSYSETTNSSPFKPTFIWLARTWPAGGWGFCVHKMPILRMPLKLLRYMDYLRIQGPSHLKCLPCLTWPSTILNWKSSHLDLGYIPTFREATLKCVLSPSYLAFLSLSVALPFYWRHCHLECQDRRWFPDSVHSQSSPIGSPWAVSASSAWWDAPGGWSSRNMVNLNPTVKTMSIT